MKATREKNIEKKVAVKKNTAAGKIQKLFKSFTKSKYSATYLVDVLLFNTTPAHPKQKPYKGVYLIKEAQYEVKAPNPFPQDIYKVLIKEDRKPKEYKKGWNILLTNKDFKELITKQPGYIHAFKFLSYETLNDTGINTAL